jgi:histidine triad (HIT) family protein
MADCLFCGILDGSIPSQQVDSDQLTMSFMDINPATPGHALVIPRAHSADLLEIEPEDLSACSAAAQRLAKRMKDVLDADGINLVNSCGEVAFQTVFHFHIHVIPRYEGDPLKLPWVPTEGDPDEIATVAQKLREEG